MATDTMLNYGTCPCGGQYQNRLVEVRMTVGGKLIVPADVPQGACPLCGSRIYKLEILEQIESLMKGGDERPGQMRADCQERLRHRQINRPCRRGLHPAVCKQPYDYLLGNLPSFLAPASCGILAI
jgi:YgiT-type zinc finger domain-containing protein